MGWSCGHCGDINPSALDACEQCGTKLGVAGSVRLEAQPISPGVLWLSTILGGVLAGIAIAIWNGRVLKRHSIFATAFYSAMGIGGWLGTVWILANFEPAHVVNANGQSFWEPGFGVPVALALGLLLVAIPYNRDTLAANQWIWNHPARRLVLSLGPGGAALGYNSFSGATGNLFGDPSEQATWLSIPVLPLIVVVISLAIGMGTLELGNVFAAVPAHHAVPGIGG